MKKSLKDYLKCSVQLIRREEIWRKEWSSDKISGIEETKFNWILSADLMNLDAAENQKKKKIQKCFKYRKLGHIWRFCKSKITEVFNLEKELKNNKILTSERSQKKELYVMTVKMRHISDSYLSNLTSIWHMCDIFLMFPSLDDRHNRNNRSCLDIIMLLISYWRGFSYIWT